MADGMNKWIGIGQLGADPELRAAGSTSVLNIRMACSESYKDRDGTFKERTEWVSVTVFGKRGEGLAKVLHKGDRICVEGSLRTRSWEKDGTKHYRTEVNASNVILCGGKRSGAEAPAPNGNGGGSSRTRQAPEPQGDEFDYGAGDDEIPF